MTTPFRTYTQALEGTVSMAVSPSGPPVLMVTTPTTGGNAGFSIIEGKSGATDLIIANAMPGNVPTFFQGGALTCQNFVLVTGSVSASIDASGNLTISNAGFGGLASVAFMIGAVSDVGGPCYASQLSGAAGTYYFLGMDNSNNYQFTIESGGSLTWGTSTTQASTDTGIKRSAAGVLQVYGGNASSSIGTLHAALAQPYVTKSSAYTMTANDGIVNGDATSAAFTVTLPAANAVPAGRQFTVKKSDSGTNAVTLSRAGTDTIEGVTTKALSTQFKYITVASDGVSEWWIIANN